MKRRIGIPYNNVENYTFAFIQVATLNICLNKVYVYTFVFVCAYLCIFVRLCVSALFNIDNIFASGVMV